MKRDILNPDMFVFVNKRCNKIKLLQWDKAGFALYEKHLEKVIAIPTTSSPQLYTA